MHDLFLRFSADKLLQFTGRIETCLGRLDEGQIWWRGADVQNSVGNLVLHLSGNVRQWIISGVGGEEDHRDRDAEFAATGGLSRAELMEPLRQTVVDANRVLRAVTPQRISDRITIQGYDVSVLEAIYHVVEHFAMHTGQILYATKLLTSEDLGFYRHLSSDRRHETIP
jgi:uncharacterized damage-inducible protein DinB